MDGLTVLGILDQNREYVIRNAPRDRLQIDGLLSANPLKALRADQDRSRAPGVSLKVSDMMRRGRSFSACTDRVFSDEEVMSASEQIRPGGVYSPVVGPMLQTQSPCPVLMR